MGESMERLVQVNVPRWLFSVHTRSEHEAGQQVSGTQEWSLPMPWEWPLLLTGLAYAVLFSAHELHVQVATMQPWLPFALSPALEIAAIALVWYMVAAGMRNAWWTIAAALFAMLALLYPHNSFWPMVFTAYVLMIVAFSCERFVERGWSYSLYAVGIVAALLAGTIVPAQQALTGTWLILTFATITYLVGVANRHRVLSWIAPAFAVWAVYDAGGLGDLYRAPLVAFVCLLSAAMIALISRGEREHDTHTLAVYRWPLYAVALVCIWLVGLRGVIDGISVPFYAAIPLALLLFALIIFGVMIVERRPQLLIVVGALAVWAIGLMNWPYWQAALAIMLLCVLVFASQWIWRLVVVASDEMRYRQWHTLLAVGGQVAVALVTISKYILSNGSSTLAHTGAASFLLLALLLEAWGWSSHDTSLWHRCRYSAGLLEALAISWELLAFHHTSVDWLVISPSTYLVVIAPFVARDETLQQRHLLSQLCAVVGAVLLLTPTLWLSFNQNDLQPTLMLGTESLLLLLLGVVTRIRFFVLSGAALVVVCVMHALFLPSFGLSPSLALGMLGFLLLAIAAVLSLARHRLQHVWSQLE
jgi:hypothetical protein